MFDSKRNSGRSPVFFTLYCLMFLVCILAAFAFSGSQQQEEQQASVREKTPTFSVEASMVMVDVTVRDRKGNLVDDLKKEDFRVYEDNAVQDISTFSLEKIAIGPPPKPR